MKRLLTILISMMLILTGCSTDKKEPISPENQNAEQNAYQVDVVVIGAGGAGMAAALTAKAEGASVVILEKMIYAGGNTTRSEGGMNAAETVFQKEKGIEDTIESMIEDTIKGGKELNSKDLVNFLAENSSPTIDWLTSLGMDMSDVAQGAGATFPRMHRPKDGSKIGGVLVPVLMKNLESNDIQILYSMKAVEILSDGKKVTGVIAEDKNGNKVTFNSNAVIIATGGFGANEDLFSKYRPDLKGFKTTNHPGATGDGILLAETLNADTVDMDQIQTNPTVEVTTQTVISESVRGKGAIMINQSGERFTSEMLTRDVLSTAILEQPEKYAYLIYDQRVMDSMKALQENFEKGIVVKGETIEDLAKELEINEKVLKETIDTWNQMVSNKKDDKFNRDTGMDEDLSKAPYYAIKVSPAVHYTMGGIKINTNTEVIDKSGNPILGLFAAGEVTGGVHGGNRLGGNAVADIMVYGRQSGLKAAEYVLPLGNLEMILPSAKDTNETSVQGNYKDGVYEGIGTGNEKGLKVKVTIEKGNITNIEIIEHSETKSILEGAKREVIAEIIKTQSTEVDIVAGATNSSNGIIEAVNNALENAK